MIARAIPVAAAAACLGFLGGRLSAPVSSTTVAARPPPPAVVAVAGACNQQVVLAAIAQLRDDLLAAPPAAPAPPAAAAPPEPTFEQRASEERSSQLVDAALARGRWTDADADALRAEMGLVRDETRDQLMRRLAVAVNGQRLRLETSGPPL